MAYVTGLVAATRMFDDTLEFLDAVAHLPIAIVTNVESRYQRDKLAAVGLAERLTQVVGADLVKQAKPDPALFRIACERLAVEPEMVVHIGDSWDADIVGAMNSGIRAVWLDRADTGAGRALPADVIRVTSLREIPALVGAG